MPENVAPKAKSEPKVPEGSVSPEGIAYQAPSRPFEEQDQPGQAPEVDEDVEARRKAQAEEAAARYSK